jgi:molecular chaperone GrpE
MIQAMANKKHTTPQSEETKREEPVEQTAPSETEAAQAAPAEEAADAPEAAASKDAGSVQKQLDELNDRFLRMAAEYDNFRRRSAKERENTHADAVSFAVSKLLPVLDNLERALKTPTEDTEYRKGVEMTYNQLLESFKALNVTAIEAAPGTAFDPNLHNAVMHVENPDLGENVIAECFQQGFQIGDKVIRHAMVQVAN